ncbi:hypothetical protein V1477_018485 [Vespula maculifrons]|uniref:Uncharacterized protein n=1 Tax=Vespula maculifrons TaxID=7453 RepID=A0ABD2AVH6_VESMC
MTSQDLLSFLASRLVAILDAVTSAHGVSSLRIITDYDYDSVLPVYNDVELLHFQLTWISTYFIFNLLQIILLQCGVTWSTSVLEPSQNFLSSE